MEDPPFFYHCEERSKPVPAKAGIHLSVIARSEATRQSPLQKVKSVPLLTTIFPKKKDFLNLCRILYIILNIFQLNDFFRILGDILLLCIKGGLTSFISLHLYWVKSKVRPPF